MNCHRSTGRLEDNRPVTNCAGHSARGQKRKLALGGVGAFKAGNSSLILGLTGAGSRADCLAAVLPEGPVAGSGQILLVASEAMCFGAPIRLRGEQMSSLKITLRPDQKIDIGSSYRLADGQVRGQALTLERDNLPAFADRFEEFLRGAVSPDVNHAMGNDVVAFVYGGTDYQPILTIINLGSNRGTLWLNVEQGPDLIATVRSFVASSR